MAQEDIQVRFFQYLKEKLAPGLTLVDELAELLCVSNDSAYRRIRGETSLSMNELSKLSKHFGVSIDKMIGSDSSTVSFNFQPLNESSFNFMDYLRSIRQQMTFIHEADEKEVVYMANEIPLFHLMHAPELAAFKLFFWQKTILDFSSFTNKKFKLGQKNVDVNEVSRNIRDLYCRIPSVEIYHAETIDTTLKQIEYYYVTGYFEDRSEAMILLERLKKLVDHIKAQCEVGFKFKPTEDGNPPQHVPYVKEGNYVVYHNEVLHTDNTILVRMGDRYLSFLTSNGISSLSTTSEWFYESTSNALSILKRRSTLISGTSEKERNSVFLNYHDKIDRLMKKLSF
ncbi:MAG: helix-turn-helix transcriptional regulator [Salibacteraceae bacterium]